MTRIRFRIGVVVVAILSVAWVWRYVSLNAYYDSLYDISYDKYTIGEIVPFEQDWIGGYNQAEGYSVRVDDFVITDYDSYVRSAGITIAQPYAVPEKVALVYITLENSDSNAEGVMLTDLQLHGIDNYVGMDWEMLYALNPILEGNPGIHLPHNSNIQLVLPFDLYRNYFGTHTWNHLHNYEWYLRITAWPTAKDIQVA